MLHKRDVSSEKAYAKQKRTVDFGIVIGVDHYPHFRPLQGAIADAKSFFAWMCETDGGSVESRHARLILSTPEPATPIHPQVDAMFGELIEIADSLGGGRRLYFYFSGHGAACAGGPSDDVALLLATWSRNFARLALSSRAYKSELSMFGLFEEVVIFLDCCRCIGERVVGLPPTMTPNLTSGNFPTREFVAYATEPGRSSFEVRDDELWQGVFTQRLISILRRSPYGISAHALKDLLECEIASVGQQAHVVNELQQNSIFGHRGTLPQLEIKFTKSAGRVRLWNGELKIVGEREANSESWTLLLEAGLYKLEGEGREPFVFQHGTTERTHVDF